MTATKLIALHKVTGTILVETGLHIGASSDTMEISGIDNPILRNAADNLPYIPGSSLKGKMRSLIEWARGEIPTDGKVIKPKLESDTARVFGIPAQTPTRDPSPQQQEIEQRGPTRLVVRDAFLSETSKQGYLKGEPLTEVKSENSINRLTAEANPRPLERVLPGVTFDFEMLYKVFDVDGDGGEGDQRRFREVLLPAMALLQADALGGAGSRGCGKIRFGFLKRDGEPLELPELTSLLNFEPAQ
jgi:CRISPR-associated protein Csm3